MNLIEKARDYAINAHWGQMYGSFPYIVHLDDVADICKDLQFPEYVVAAAYLHDIVEDTDVTANQVSQEFGYEVATLVYAVTDAKGENRKERKAATYPKILAHPYGVHLKLADRIANMRSSMKSKDPKMFKMYKDEHEEFKQKLATPGVAENMWQILENLANRKV